MASGKQEQDEDRQPFLPATGEDAPFPEEASRKSSLAWKGYLRLILEIVMVVTIITLFIRPSPGEKAAKSSPVPSCMFFPYNLNVEE
jgi:hypothetical protein